MIEFTLNRDRNGKKSRWTKKYPRKRILKRGGEKAAGWYPHNWYMVLLTIRRGARDLKVLMFHHLSYWHSSILKIFRVRGRLSLTD